MGNLIYFAYDVFSDSVSNRLAVLMYSRPTIENDAFINHNTYIRCLYKDWNDLVIQLLHDEPTDLMLS
jgi:hypothetical protein